MATPVLPVIVPGQTSNIDGCPDWDFQIHDAAKLFAMNLCKRLLENLKRLYNFVKASLILWLSVSPEILLNYTGYVSHRPSAYQFIAPSTDRKK
jgi:hypothetical protein